MNNEDRNTILETVDILRLIGGNNGFSNLRPNIKRQLLNHANRLKGIVDRDTQVSNSMQVEEFDGEVVHES